MQKMDIWAESCTVRFGAIDKSDSITLSAVMNFFQEAAISHAENLGVGRKAMERSNQVWILSRMSVQVDRRPMYGETVTVRTWPRGGEKLFMLRDFDLHDANDIAAVRARSCWLIIDRKKRHPLRPKPIIDKLPKNEGLDSLPAAVSLTEKTLGWVHPLQKTMERRTLYTDVDYNGHVNNVSYIRWIEDAIDPALLEQAKRLRLDINYISEILPNDVTGIWSARIDDPAADTDACAFAFEGRKEPVGKQVSFRAELRLWQ